MNRDLPLIPTFVFLALILGAIYLYVSSIEKISATSVQQVVQDSENTIWALFGDALIDISDEKENRTFSQHGFRNHVGQVIPLASGEWILNVGAQSDYVKKVVERTTLSETDEYQGSGSLLKCSSDFVECQPWGEAELQFERAFEGIELKNHNLLLFKAEQKRIFLVAPDGFILDQIQNEELWFGVSESADGELIGLNTDRRELVKVNIEKNSIAVEKVLFDFTRLIGDTDKVSLRSKIVVHGDSFWLLSFVLDDKLEPKIEKTKKLIDLVPSLLSIDRETGNVRKLPYDFRAGAEVEKIANSIYFSDFAKYEIKRFDLVSETLHLVTSKNLQTAYEQDKTKIREQKSKLYKAIALISLIALSVLIWLILKSKPTQKRMNFGEPNADILGYDSSAQDKELTYIARVFSKEAPTKFEARILVLFKKIDDIYVYYPKGIFGKGRVIPNNKVLVSLYKLGERSQNIINSWLLVSIVMIFISVVIGISSRQLGLLIFLASMLGLVFGVLLAIKVNFQRRKILENLLVHDSRLTFSDVFTHVVKITPLWVCWYCIISGTILLLIPIFLMSKYSLNHVSPTIYYYFSLGVLSLVLGLKLRSMKQNR